MLRAEVREGEAGELGEGGQSQGANSLEVKAIKAFWIVIGASAWP